MSTLMFSDQGGNGHLVVCGEQDFFEARWELSRRLLDTTPVNHGKWQQLDVSKSDAHATYELLNVAMWYEMPQNITDALHYIDPDFEWAEGHFRERVAGRAVNPGNWHDKWPYHAGKVELHQHGGKYDHNYMERFWPTDLVNEYVGDLRPFQGYRFGVGDLDDVVDMLSKDPGTRQAYLPIWFPEDTGATEGQRVPCTLGYHFIIRDGKLHLQYNMRSCEIYRHFTNDVYMAVRLAHWVATAVMEQMGRTVGIGQLTLNIVSLHGFVGDHDHIERFQNP